MQHFHSRSYPVTHMLLKLQLLKKLIYLLDNPSHAKYGVWLGI